MSKMEMVKVVREIPRYRIQKSEVDMNYLWNIDNDDFKVYFNRNNTGLADFHNFLQADQVYLEKYNDIVEKMQENGHEYFTVISFYRENGWDGVFTNSAEDCLVRRPNNLVNGYRDGLMFLVTAKEEEPIKQFEKDLQRYINEGLYIYEIYDELAQDYTNDNCIDNDDTVFSEWIENMKEVYGFEYEDFLI